MDDGIIGLIAIALTIITTVTVALLVLTRQSNRLEEQMRGANAELRTEMREANAELRTEMRTANSELRSEIRDLANRFGERISKVESNQARLEGANSVMQAQAHTHAPPMPLDDD